MRGAIASFKVDTPLNDLHDVVGTSLKVEPSENELARRLLSRKSLIKKKKICFVLAELYCHLLLKLACGPPPLRERVTFITIQ